MPAAIAKALAVWVNRHDDEEGGNFAGMDAAIEAIRKQIAGFEDA